MKTFNFGEWLLSQGITPTEYAEKVGLHKNTIFRRARGELETPKEVIELLKMLEEHARLSCRFVSM